MYIKMLSLRYGDGKDLVIAPLTSVSHALYISMYTSHTSRSLSNDSMWVGGDTGSACFPGKRRLYFGL